LIFDEGRLFQKEDGAFGYNFDGNSTLIVPSVPSIFLGVASENSWYLGYN
jgi:hypothetical protein